MGARGPGAKPVKKPAAGQKAPRKRAAWAKKGLSRPERVISFIESLPMTVGPDAGKPVRLRPWQKAIIEGIYGPADEDGRRVVRTALLTMPRKNGKTALAAWLALAHLLGPEAEPRGQVYSAASDRDQAGIIFREMKAVILDVPEFAERVLIKDFSKTMEDSVTGSTYAALSSDARKAHGLSPSFFVFDELAQSLTRHLWDNLSTGTGARQEPLGIVISTQSSDPHHVMSELVNYGKQVRDGLIEDPSFHGVIYEAPADADIWDEQVWAECNPALGDFRSLDEMRRFAAQAKRLPAKQAVFENLYLNRPVEAEQNFIAAADWDACRGEVNPEALRGKACYGGLDLSSVSDLTSLTLFFESGEVLCWFWVPRDNLAAREDQDRVPYATWERQGLIEAPQGRAIDRRAIALRLGEIAALYDLQGLAYDRWRFEDLSAVLSDEGITLPLVPWGQGFKDMGPAVDLLETAVLNRTLIHPGNPVLTWCLANARVQVDPAGARKISKDRSIERVDGLIALVMALGLHGREPKPVAYDFSRPLVLSL